VKNLLIGAAAGAVATVPMTMVMESLHERLAGEPPRPLPPREVAEGAAVKAGVHRELDERQMENLTLATHVGYGAACGAVFGVVAPRNPAAAIASGVAFGLTVWAGSYLGWLPAAGIRHHARYDPRARNVLMIAAHIVYGLATGACVAAMRGTEPPARISRRDRSRA
jgi:uncharacterized membrane protein YagU involved in acid resistance